MNMKSKRIFNTVTAIAVLLTSFSTMIAGVSAQNLHRGLVVRLPGEDDFYIDYINVQPGESLAGNFIVQHEFLAEDKPATIYIFAQDFDVAEDGVTAIEPENGYIIDADFSLARFISFDLDQTTLPQYGAEQTVNFTIDIPADARPGFRYARILVSGTDPKIQTAEDLEAISTGANIKSRISVATLLVSIGNPSDYIIDGEIDSISLRDIEGNPGVFGWLFDVSPVTASARLNNNGNQPLLIGGNVTWHTGDPANPNLFDKINAGRHRILPGKARTYSNSWVGGLLSAVRQEDQTIGYSWDLEGDLNPQWGKHFVDYRITYTDHNGEKQILTHTAEFWFLPWKAILLVIVVLLLVGAYIRYRRRRKKN